MGSFAYTCAISGLPIEAGDKVRYFLLTKNPYYDGAGNTCYIHDLWFPRTLPLRAVYNDYGSVEKVEEGPARDVWLEGLRIDLIERGWGDNSVHDVPTSKDMSFDELLGAVQEGRILVSREVESRLSVAIRELHRKMADLGYKSPLTEDAPIPESPHGVPTLSRIMKVVTAAGRPLFQGYGVSGYLVDELEYGCVRVRWHGSGDDFGADAQKLGELLPLFPDYAAVVAAGNGAYAHAADLLLRPKPGTADYHGTRKANRKPLPVGHAMIREDVWQALLGVKMEEYDLAQLRQDVRREATRRTEARHGDTMSEIMSDMNSEQGRASWIFQDSIPYTVALGTHLELLIDKGPVPDTVLDTVAEFAHITAVLSYCRYQWRPSSSSGPQFGEWRVHARLAKAILTVATPKSRAERRAALLGSFQNAWWRFRYWVTELVLKLFGKKKAEETPEVPEEGADEVPEESEEGADEVPEESEPDAGTNAPEEAEGQHGPDDPLSPDRECGEPEAERLGQCPSCREPTKGSRSTATGRDYPYCAKCITRATAATDSWATTARGDDTGPFTDL